MAWRGDCSVFAGRIVRLVCQCRKAQVADSFCEDIKLRSTMNFRPTSSHLSSIWLCKLTPVLRINYLSWICTVYSFIHALLCNACSVVSASIHVTLAISHSVSKYMFVC